MRVSLTPDRSETRLSEVSIRDESQANLCSLVGDLVQADLTA